MTVWQLTTGSSDHRICPLHPATVAGPGFPGPACRPEGQKPEAHNARALVMGLRPAGWLRLRRLTSCHGTQTLGALAVCGRLCIWKTDPLDNLWDFWISQVILGYPWISQILAKWMSWVILGYLFKFAKKISREIPICPSTCRLVEFECSQEDRERGNHRSNSFVLASSIMVSSLNWARVRLVGMGASSLRSGYALSA